MMMFAFAIRRAEKDIKVEVVETSTEEKEIKEEN